MWFTSDAWEGTRSGTSTSETFDSPGDYTINFHVEDYHGQEEISSTTVTIENPEPTADAGGTRSTDQGGTVQFDGSGSSAGEGASSLSYAWTSNAWSGTLTQATPTTDPLNTDGTFTVTLTVTNEYGESDTDTTSVTVEADEPTADAGPSRSTDQGGTVQFDGTGSVAGVNATDLDYTWTSNAWSGTLTGSTPTTPSLDDDGTFTVTLEVENEFGHTDTDTTSVTINRSEPTADAGSDESITQGDTVKFDGSGSTSGPNTSIESYEWTSDAWSGALTGVSPSHEFTEVGTFTVTLEVENGFGHKDTDTMTVTVEADEPTADAGADRTEYVGESFNFDGSGSSGGKNASISHYRWTSALWSGNLTGESPSYEPDAGDRTTTTVSLEVENGYGHTDTDTMDLTVLDNRDYSDSVGLSVDAEHEADKDLIDRDAPRLIEAEIAYHLYRELMLREDKGLSDAGLSDKAVTESDGMGTSEDLKGDKELIKSEGLSSTESESLAKSLIEAIDISVPLLLRTDKGSLTEDDVSASDSLFLDSERRTEDDATLSEDLLSDRSLISALRVEVGERLMKDSIRLMAEGFDLAEDLLTDRAWELMDSFGLDHRELLGLTARLSTAFGLSDELLAGRLYKSIVSLAVLDEHELSKAMILHEAPRLLELEVGYHLYRELMTTAKATVGEDGLSDKDLIHEDATGLAERTLTDRDGFTVEDGMEIDESVLLDLVAYYSEALAELSEDHRLEAERIVRESFTATELPLTDRYMNYSDAMDFDDRTLTDRSLPMAVSMEVLVDEYLHMAVRIAQEVGLTEAIATAKDLRLREGADLLVELLVSQDVLLDEAVAVTEQPILDKVMLDEDGLSSLDDYLLNKSQVLHESTDLAEALAMNRLIHVIDGLITKEDSWVRSIRRRLVQVRGELSRRLTLKRASMRRYELK